jgi:hypothetical protein
MRRKRSSPNCSMLVPGQSGSFHSNLAILMNILIRSAHCQLKSPLARWVMATANLPSLSRLQSLASRCYNTVRTPTLCKPDTSDRPLLFSFNLLNLATPLLSYAVRLVLLIFVLLSSLPCYLYDAVLILTSDILYSLIDTFLSILRYINTHVFVVEP